MAKAEIIKLKLDIKQAKKELSSLRSDLGKTNKAAGSAARKMGGGLRLGGAAVAGMAGHLGASAVSGLLARLVPVMESLARSIIPNTIASLEKISAPAEAQGQIQDLARRAASLGIELSPEFIKQSFASKVAVSGLQADAAKRVSELLEDDLLESTKGAGVDLVASISKDQQALAKAIGKAVGEEIGYLLYGRGDALGAATGKWAESR